MQRVLHVYKDVYPPVAGGIERHIDAIRRAVPGRRHDVIVCARRLRTTRAWTPYGMEVRVAELGRLLSAPLAPGFPRQVRRAARGALVHLHMPNPTGEVALGAVPGRTPVVASYHCDIFRQRALLPLYGPLVVACLRRADAVVVGSEGLARSSPLVRRAGVATTLVPYAVDVASWEAGTVPAAEIAALRERYGGRFVVAVGRLVSYKGFDRLIGLAPRLTVPLVVVGDGPLRPELEALVARLGLTDRVHLAGRVSDAGLAAHLAAAETFVMASVNRAESFGVATLEAQAAGLPVVATDVGTGTNEAFAPGTSGLLVPADDDDALVAALNELAASQERRTAMGAAGRRRVEERNSLAALGPAMERVYAQAEAKAAARS